MYAYLYIHMGVYMDICMNICIYASIYIYGCTDIYMDTYVLIRISIGIYTFIDLCTFCLCTHAK
jgi:hypothetical protein